MPARLTDWIFVFDSVMVNKRLTLGTGPEVVLVVWDDCIIANFDAECGV